jgi:CubicO group peptidase (beta-lactamase class C family)
MTIGLDSTVVQAQQKLPPPESTDPVALGLMSGFPPAPGKQITFNNFYFKYPNIRWAFHHLRELRPTSNIWRGKNSSSHLKYASRDLGLIRFEDDKGQPTTVDEWQKNTYTDAMIVLHKGKVIYERYYAGMRPEQPHILWSVTKSFTGLLTTQLIYEGLINPSAMVTTYVPELTGTAWEDATVQETLDMTTGVAFREIYTDPNSEVFQYAYACGILPPPPNYRGAMAVTEFLKTLKKEGEHGLKFKYRTVNSEVLGWILRRVTGKSFAELVSEIIWQPLGAEQDAYVWVDGRGAELMGAGLNVTLRDLARVGEMLRCGGLYRGRQILSSETIRTIREGGDREKFKGNYTNCREGYSYRNQWWVSHNLDGVYEAKGIHGQFLYINPAAQIVIAKFSSHPVAGNCSVDPLNAKAFAAIAGALR